jgi:hypothetical protein
MFVLYNTAFPALKQDVLDELKANNVDPVRITNALAGASGEWASYWLYDNGAYEADLEMVPMEGDSVHSVKMVFHEYNTFVKIDELLQTLGFAQKITGKPPEPEHEAWDYETFAKELERYDEALGAKQQWVIIKKIVVATEREKEQLLLACRYIHNLHSIDTDFIAVNSLAHLYLDPNLIEVKGKYDDNDE